MSLVESNLKQVKLFAQHGATFPLFRSHPCVAEQSRVHLHSNTQHVSPRTRSAQRIQRFSCMIQHEPLLSLRTAQHVESLYRSFEHRA